MDGFGSSVAHRLPARTRRKLGFDDDSAIGSRRIEIGCGPFPQRGYIHVDVDPAARHLEALTPAWRLPFPADWAEEIVSVHSLEHIHPSMLLATLREWRRVLRPGGRVRVHVPNAPELMASFLDSPVESKWRIMGALLGMYCAPEVGSPEELHVGADHQLLLDSDILSWAFAAAGFRDFADLTTEVTDRHTDSWKEVVPHFSLVAEAVKPPASTDS